MKKIFFSSRHQRISYTATMTICLWMIAVSCFAQSHKYKNTMTGNAFRAGLRGGFEWSNMYLKSIAHDYHGKSRPAFQVCLVGEYDIMETVALQTGLGYYELKTHATDPLSNDPVVLDIMMRGIQVPFLLQPHFSYGEMDIYGSF